MCGLAGEVRFDGRPADVAAVERSCAVMAARGPDGSGIWAQGPAALGHRRLSIIDLSARRSPAHGRPVRRRDHRLQRLHLQLPPAPSRADRPGALVLLPLGHRGRGQGLRRVGNGMRLALPRHVRLRHRSSTTAADWCSARDRLGIKPLYLDSTRTTGSGSPPPCRPCSPPAASTPRSTATALGYYMTFHSVVPAPHTILNGVRKLPPATVRVIEPDGRTRDQLYWDPAFARDGARRDLSAEDWQDALIDALRTAVERRQVADVPVGVLLSGGIDSSLVVALLAEAGQKDLSTFSVGFDDAGGESGNEFEYSDLVAAHFGTDHHRIKIESSPSPARHRRCHRSHERADGQPRLRGLLPAEPGGVPPCEGRPVGPGGRRGAGRLRLVPAARRGRAGPTRSRPMHRCSSTDGSHELEPAAVRPMAPGRRRPHRSSSGRSSVAPARRRRSMPRSGTTRRSCWSTIR